jgi:hypothetical protein
VSVRVTGSFGSNGNHEIPERFERFASLFLRVAISVIIFTRSCCFLVIMVADGTVDTVAEALDKFLTENVLPNATYDSNFHFAKEYLWKEEVDMAFKAYRPDLDDIHAEFSGRFEVGAPAVV